jgi:hypothetical protein
MKKEYDFSIAEQGKLYSPDAALIIPIYLEADTLAFVAKLAKKKKTDLPRSSMS